MKKLVAGTMVWTALSSPVWAESQTVTLSVSPITCPACPIAIKKALSKVEGVEKAEVSYERKEAVVTFDNTKTSTDMLIKATGDIGYPSEAKK